MALLLDDGSLQWTKRKVDDEKDEGGSASKKGTTEPTSQWKFACTSPSSSCRGAENTTEVTIYGLLQALDLYDCFQEDQARARAIADILLRLWSTILPDLPPITPHKAGCIHTPFIQEYNYAYVETSGSIRLVLDGAYIPSTFEDAVPRFIEYCLSKIDTINMHWRCAEDQQYLRHQLTSKGGVAFVANGSILPRADGRITAGPSSTSVPFMSPNELESTFDLPHAGRISGLLIPEGVTVITGGGFHGKSTLLRALAYGVYDKVPGDGREYVVSTLDAVTVRAEDGR
jgi:hypothetical protein